jgi:hypothetical protein
MEKPLAWKPKIPLEERFRRVLKSGPGARVEVRKERLIAWA